MPSKRKNTSDDISQDIDFEEALQKIELIIHSMEDDQLPLDQLVTQYEAGSRLIKRCESLLSSARERIELITLATHQESPSQPSPLHASNDDNDSSLF